MAKFGKELAVRTLSGAVLLLVVVGAVSVSEYGFAALMLTICVGSLWEFYRMAAKKGLSVDRVYPVAVGGVAVAMSFLVARGTLPVVWLSIFFPLLYVIFVYELRRRPPEPFIHIAVAVGGLVYAALPMSLMCFVAFYGGSYDAWTILCYIFTVWVNDIFAYLTGLALVVVVSGVLGALVESMFKRSAGVKDSGAIIPGHGGFMDRFDALIFSVPFVFAYFTIFAG